MPLTFGASAGAPKTLGTAAKYGDPLSSPGGIRNRNVLEMQGLELGAQETGVDAMKQQLEMQKTLFEKFFGGDGSSISGFLGGGQGGGTDLTSLLEQLSGFGEGEKARIEQGFQDAQGTALANLEMRGLGGSSLAGSAIGGIEGEKQLALGDLSDRTIEQTIGVQERAADRALTASGQQMTLLAQLLGGIF